MWLKKRQKYCSWFGQCNKKWGAVQIKANAISRCTGRVDRGPADAPLLAPYQNVSKLDLCGAATKAAMVSAGRCDHAALPRRARYTYVRRRRYLAARQAALTQYSLNIPETWWFGNILRKFLWRCIWYHALLFLYFTFKVWVFISWNSIWDRIQIGTYIEVSFKFSRKRGTSASRIILHQQYEGNCLSSNQHSINHYTVSNKIFLTAFNSL